MDTLRAQPIPVLNPDQRLDIERLRCPGEQLRLSFIIAMNVVVGIIGATMLLGAWANLGITELLILLFPLWFYLLNKWTYVLFYWFLYGNSIRVSDVQYPDLYNAVKTACNYIDLQPVPTVFVMHGSGMLELFLIKRFTKRGILVFTSEMVDSLLGHGESRELMMIIGRQLGHIKLGHYKGWFFKDFIGRLALFVHASWWRKCHLSADRVGLLVAGDLQAAKVALITVTVGKVLALQTTDAGIDEQSDELRSRPMARIRELLLTYPYMIHRITELQRFGAQVASLVPDPGARKVVAALPPEANKWQVIVQGNAIIGDHGVILQPT